MKLTDVVLHSYSNFNKLFHLCTYVLDHQLEAVIMQDKGPIAFYSQKINIAQKWYPTHERERKLLLIIETCKE
jgi:hypothetical protein